MWHGKKRKVLMGKNEFMGQLDGHKILLLDKLSLLAKDKN
jgi:hypothetical protein